MKPLRFFSFNATLAKACLVAALTCAPAALAGTITIDDFSAGANFSLVNPGSNTTVNFTGAGPYGGARRTVMSTVFGSHSASLNTGAGTFSTSITGYSDTFLRWGKAISPGSTSLDLNGALTFDLEFTAFALGAGDAGGGNDGLFLHALDSANAWHGFTVAGSTLSALAANNGGVLSVAFASFTNGPINGAITGLQIGFDDRDLSATLTKVSITNNATVPDATGTVALLALALAGMAATRRRRA